RRNLPFNMLSSETLNRCQPSLLGQQVVNQCARTQVKVRGRAQSSLRDSLSRSLLIGKDRLQRIQIVARGECLETLARFTPPQIAAQDSLQQQRQFVVRYAAEDLATHGLVFAEPPAKEDMIAVERFARTLHLRAEQPDVAHVVLRTGVWASGK